MDSTNILSDFLQLAVEASTAKTERKIDSWSSLRSRAVTTRDGVRKYVTSLKIRTNRDDEDVQSFWKEWSINKVHLKEQGITVKSIFEGPLPTYQVSLWKSADHQPASTPQPPPPTTQIVESPTAPPPPPTKQSIKFKRPTTVKTTPQPIAA